MIRGLAVVAFLTSTTGIMAAETAPTAERLAFFEKKSRPVLVNHCCECHSAKADKIKGGLSLDNREGLRQGGESGPAFVVG